MSNIIKVQCVICDYGGSHMSIPSEDKTKTELDSLWTIYHKLIKVEPREPSVCYLKDFSYRDSPVFYSFCDFCLPHVRRLCDLYNQMDKQIELIWAIPNFIARRDANNNCNISEPNQVDVCHSTSGSDGNKRKRLKLTDVPVPVQNNSQDNTGCEDDEVVILEENVCAQNQNVQMVSINSDDDEDVEIFIKDLDSTHYVFTYMNKCFFFMRSKCLLKFHCSLCSAHAQNITGIINHIWTQHCEDGKVKPLPNYRIDVSNSCSSNQSPVDKENMSIDEESSSEPEIINDNSSGLLFPLGKNVYHKRELLFNPRINGMYRCSFCKSIVQKDEIVSHTTTCLPEKLRRKKRKRRKPPVTAKNFVPPKTGLGIMYKNGWPYFSTINHKFNCGVQDCEIKEKRLTQLFSHIRRVHAGVKDGSQCPHCKLPQFLTPTILWDHLYKKHNLTHL